MEQKLIAEDENGSLFLILKSRFIRPNRRDDRYENGCVLALEGLIYFNRHKMTWLNKPIFSNYK